MLDDAEQAADEAQIQMLDRSAGDSLCFLCEKQVRLPSQLFGQICQADVRAAARDAAKSGPAGERAFSLLRRKGGKPFKDAIIAYRCQCSGLGRGRSRNSSPTMTQS